MQLKNKLILSFPAPLALPQVKRLDIALLSLAHMSLLVAWVSFFMRAPAILGISIAFIAFLGLHFFGSAQSKTAKKILLNRVALSFVATVLYGAHSSYMTFYIGESYTPFQAWFLLSYILGGLAMFDLYWISKGFNGFTPIAALKNFMQENK